VLRFDANYLSAKIELGETGIDDTLRFDANYLSAKIPDCYIDAARRCGLTPIIYLLK
tara:strand:+ start:30 stop:200 length:171 start_codon:yes stop_codon:yes gene_type:complete